MNNVTLDIGEILKDAKPSETFGYVTKEIKEEQIRENYPHPIGYKERLKRARAWNYLSNKIVGAE